MDQESFQAYTALFPKSYELIYYPDDQFVTFTLKDPCQNMNLDGGAFEGWVLILHKKSPRTQIILNIPDLPPHQYSNAHFQRFLYRVHKFNEMDYSWFVLAPDLENRVKAFSSYYYSTPKRIGLPRSAVAPGNKGEKMLLNRFSAKDSILHAMNECGAEPIHCEFPIGVYWGTKKADVNSENRIFPNAKSFLDLWNVREKQLNIFELSNQDPHVGIVSELFFFAHWCRDVFLDSENSNIHFPHLPKKPVRGVEDFYDEAGEKKPLEVLYAWFLADCFHPLLDMVYICEMLSTPQIKFQCLKYSYDLPVAIQNGEEK